MDRETKFKSTRGVLALLVCLSIGMLGMWIYDKYIADEELIGSPATIDNAHWLYVDVSNADVSPELFCKGAENCNEVTLKWIDGTERSITAEQFNQCFNKGDK